MEVEGRVAEGSRDAEEGSGARVRRSRCGPETPLAGWSVCHSPLPTPSINNSRAEIAPVNPSVPQPYRGADQHMPARSTLQELTDRERSSELRSREEDSTAAQREVPSFLWGFV